MYDYVELYNDNEMTNASRIGRYCGNSAPKQLIVSSGRFMIITFVSDKSVNRGGFQVVVTATLG
jgi:hypothetical protein